MKVVFMLVAVILSQAYSFTVASNYSVDVVVITTDSLINRAKELFAALENWEIITPSDIISSYVKTLKVIPDIIRILSGSASVVNQATKDKLLAQLKVLSDLQNRELLFLQNVKNTINLIVLKNQIATSSKVINSCYQDLMHFLQNPVSEPEKYRLLLCYNTIMQEVRHLGRILKEEEFTLESPKLFQYIIHSDGFCNGTKIVSIYKYLFGLLFLGCETAIISENLKYNQSSNTLTNECIGLTVDIERHMYELYDVCIGDTCDIVLGSLGSSIKLYVANEIKRVADEFRTRLPWFSFSVFKFLGNPHETITGNYLPSFVTINYGIIHFIVLWTPFETHVNPDDSSLSFFLEFDTEFYDSEYRGMNITRNLSGSRAVVIGYFRSDVNGKSYQRCTSDKTITLLTPTTTTKATLKSPSISQDSSSSSAVVINIPVLFLLILTVFIFQLTK